MMASSEYKDYICILFHWHSTFQNQSALLSFLLHSFIVVSVAEDMRYPFHSILYLFLSLALSFTFFSAVASVLAFHYYLSRFCSNDFFDLHRFRFDYVRQLFKLDDSISYVEESTRVTLAFNIEHGIKMLYDLCICDSRFLLCALHSVTRNLILGTRVWYWSVVVRDCGPMHKKKQSVVTSTYA